MLGGGDRKDMARYLAISQVGLEMAAPPAVGAVLDYYLGTAPWCVVAGAALGLIGGLAHLVHLANKQEDGQKPSDKQGPS
jgi:F0F1-type ATP synthase assembly protein I